MLVFGDSGGNIYLADRDFRLDRKIKAFRGEVKGIYLSLYLSYLYILYI
jgi:hypothetical protein